MWTKFSDLTQLLMFDIAVFKVFIYILIPAKHINIIYSISITCRVRYTIIKRIQELKFK